MLYRELQSRTFAGGYPQFVDCPTDGGRPCQISRAFCWGHKAENAEIGGHRFIDNNVGGTGFGDIGRKIFKQVFQLCIVGGHRHMGGVWIGRPIV